MILPLFQGTYAVWHDLGVASNDSSQTSGITRNSGSRSYTLFMDEEGDDSGNRNHEPNDTLDVRQECVKFVASAGGLERSKVRKDTASKDTACRQDSNLYGGMILFFFVMEHLHYPKARTTKGRLKEHA